jgi:hypothetical protein
MAVMDPLMVALGEPLMEMVSGTVKAAFGTLVGVIALVFIVKKEFVRLLEFALLAVVVGTFVYVPQLWVSIAKVVAGAIGVPTGN